MTSKQYGNGRSTTTQLLSYLDKCIDTIVPGGVVDTIYFDFAKAFGSLPQERLLGKLKSYGISGKVLECIKAFLSIRRQIVNFNEMKSDPAKLKIKIQKQLKDLLLRDLSPNKIKTIVCDLCFKSY